MRKRRQTDWGQACDSAIQSPTQTSIASIEAQTDWGQASDSAIQSPTQTSIATVREIFTIQEQLITE